jgi:hypothetical protein
VINTSKKYCYRIYHIENLNRILQVGLCSKNHPLSTSDFVPIGNPQIINTRSSTKVRINGYGNIGDYIPFYFTPRSIMLYNIVTGYWAPLVPKISKSDIIVIRCEINQLIKVNRFFFTNGQANDALTRHYNDLSKLNKIDWANIQNSNFSKSDDDFDRARRYQAEFLVYYHVPVEAIESIIVYNEGTAKFVKDELSQAGVILPVHISPKCFFN